MSTAAATKATWTMTSTELARVFAEHFGYTVKGNWIQSPAGTPVACGWGHFAQKLTAKGWIKQGSGIDWRRAGETPRLRRATKDERGYWA